MSWPNFDGKPYTREQLAAHINALDFSRWKHKDGSHGKPAFITLHNTSSPDIKLWLSWSADKRQQYIHNMQPYYENMGWRGGPHFFVPPDETICAFGFNDPMAAGTHASCFNAASIGIEMVGEFNVEPFDSGPGAQVRDNAIFLMALLHNKIGLTPEPYAYNQRGLHFHIECKADNHDCPGRFVHKADVVARVKASMAAVSTGKPAIVTPADNVQHDIVMTEFGGGGDPGDNGLSAYGGRTDASVPQVALPFRFARPLPVVVVQWHGKTCDAQVNDIGPHYDGAANKPFDPYWLKNDRPRAEQETANKAGIDGTPALFDQLGIPGKRYTRSAIVSWWFKPAK